MRPFFTIGFALLLLSTSASAQQTTPPNQAPPAGAQAAPAPAPAPLDRAKVSYALGMDLGAQLRKQGLEIDAAIFAKALNDALTGAKLEMTTEESQKLIAAFQAGARKTLEAAAAAAGLKNKQVGEAFLAANKTKQGVVTLPSGLQYKILKEGTGPKPTLDDTVECHYRGRLLDGTEFDSSYKRNQAAAFPVKGVIKGWTEALQLMPVGSKWELYLPSALAYGERGAGQTIAPNATLVFEVELLSIVKAKS
jgi:FKBP-type peptidyl-prolyl cis-trans isomerase FklB